MVTDNVNRKFCFFLFWTTNVTLVLCIVGQEECKCKIYKKVTFYRPDLMKPHILREQT